MANLLTMVFMVLVVVLHVVVVHMGVKIPSRPSANLFVLQEVAIGLDMMLRATARDALVEIVQHLTARRDSENQIQMVPAVISIQMEHQFAPILLAKTATISLVILQRMLPVLQVAADPPLNGEHAVLIVKYLILKQETISQ